MGYVAKLENLCGTHLRIDLFLSLEPLRLIISTEL